MKKIFILSSLIAVTLATPSFATPTELDKKTVASKAYVDTKQDKIPAATEDYQSVLVDTDTDGEIGKLMLLTEDYMENQTESFASYGVSDNEMATAGAIRRELENNWQQKLPELDLGYTPGVVLMPGTEAGQFTPKFIIPGLDDFISLGDTVDPIFLWRNTDLFGGNNNLQAITMAYEDAFRLEWNDIIDDNNSIGLVDVSEQGLLYSPASLKLVSDVWKESQRTITGHAVNVADSLLTDSTTDGVVQKRAIYNDVAANYTASTQSTHIPTMGAVMSIVNTNAPTGTPGNVAMYDPTTGALGDGVATYSGATAQNPYNATNDAAKIATAAAVETKQTKRVCAGYEPGHENDPDYCWLWDFPD